MYRRPTGGNNPSVSIAASSLYTREPLCGAKPLIFKAFSSNPIRTIVPNKQEGYPSGYPSCLFRAPHGRDSNNHMRRGRAPPARARPSRTLIFTKGENANESLPVYRAALLRYIIKVHPTVVASVANRTLALYNMCILQEGELVWIS